jgi:RimJ/RimL family protein N-acetyltransferase
MKLITDKSEKVARWAGQRLGVTFSPPYVAVGIESHGKPVGAVIFNDYQGGNIEVSAVGRGAFKKGILQHLFRYAFNDLECSRVTVRTRADNEKVIDLAIRFGWRVEGRLRQFYPDGCDAVVFGMLRKECNFL